MSVKYLGSSITCAVGSEDTMGINCVWNHYFLTMIDAPSLCIFIFSFTGSLLWLSAECGVVCYPVMSEVRYQNTSLPAALSALDVSVDIIYW